MASTPYDNAESSVMSSAVHDTSATTETTKSVKLDAGLRSLDHYKNKLPPWRYQPREMLIPLVRWETKYVERMQGIMRCPALDSYFSITANLGTHTFFMVMLPILFWCGYTDFGRGLVHILASGVFFSGFVKDLLCLPRPLSPPLNRITMSGSASLEYGFPSTHSTNAVSVAFYALFLLNSSDIAIQPKLKLFLESLAFCYALSITIGRIYCGMHGFFDVIVGSLLGALISLIQCTYGRDYDTFLFESSFGIPIILVLIILVLVRIHPEPADDCPCFDDSVAFAGVMIGVELGNWHFARTRFAWNHPVPATVPFLLSDVSWLTTVSRIIIGVFVIFAWREVMKPVLLKYLPPVFRVIENLGLSLPRKFFVQASNYTKIPMNLKTDNVIPPVSEIPSIWTSFRHPRKNRSVSVGPQSAADAYEVLAYREKKRRESSSMATATVQTKEQEYRQSYPFGRSTSNSFAHKPMSNGLPTPAPSGADLYNDVFGSQAVLDVPMTPNTLQSPSSTPNRRASDDQRQFDSEEKEMFSKLEKPRVRYDVEVVTKLIVYTGIAWIAVEGNPILFELIGLGMG